MSQKQILVTGFERFGHRQRPNASSEIALPAVKSEYGDRVETLILPTSRNLAVVQLIMAIGEVKPAAIVMFGKSAGRKVSVEQRAKNWRFNLLIPDNEGNRAVGKINKNGPDYYASNGIYASLQEANLPARLSKDAGAFVCNEVMYSALQQSSESVPEKLTPTGFIHFGNGLRDQLVAEASLRIIDVLLKGNL